MKYLPLLAFILLTDNAFAQGQTLDQSLKVITYNIWNGFDWGKDVTRHDLFIDWVKEQNPDVLALQELCGYTSEKLKKDAAAWGHPYTILLKEDGYPVGITSKEPIQLKNRVLHPLWHGMLHVKTYDIDFFVVHLSPADVNFRMREAADILQRIEACGNENFMVLGDFNALSPMDADVMRERKFLLERYQKGDASNKNQHKNLRDRTFDYSVMSRFLGIPTIDVCHRLLEKRDRYSFPVPILVGKYFDDQQQVEQSRQRIDYILASPNLAKHCSSVSIIHSETTDQLSDHYPVVAIWRKF